MAHHAAKPRLESLEIRITPARYAPPGMRREEYTQAVIKAVNAEIDILVEQLSTTSGAKRDKKDRVKFMLRELFQARQRALPAPSRPAVGSSPRAPVPFTRLPQLPPPPKKMKKSLPPVNVQNSNTQESPLARYQEYEEEDEQSQDRGGDGPIKDQLFMLGLDFLKERQREKEAEQKEDQEPDDESPHADPSEKKE